MIVRVLIEGDFFFFWKERREREGMMMTAFLVERERWTRERRQWALY